MPLPRPLICGCASLELSAAERDFFRLMQPLGFILMGRNCCDPAQVRRLTKDLRATLAHADAPILIDMEGGRVARLKPPHWPSFPAAGLIGKLYQCSPQDGLELARLVGHGIGFELHQLGINVDCAPVLDLRYPETHDAIGDRSFGEDPDSATALAAAMGEGLMAAGVLPVIKHLPGHGRVTLDPHFDLPSVHATQATLTRDLLPFQALKDWPLGMTSHILFTAIDPILPASQSPIVIQKIIREMISFDGLLISDDLDMKALGGDVLSKSLAVLAAGTDSLLWCNTGIDDLRPLLELPSMSETSWQRWQHAQALLSACNPVAFTQHARLNELWRSISEANIA
jgi:beta-N-acetylhexosaminidase